MLLFLLVLSDAVSNEGRNLVEVVNGSTYLEVNITSGSLFNDVMNDLVWYYNGYPILVTSNFTYPEGSKSLETSVYGGGIFSVRYAGFLVIPQDKICENFLLDSLTNYPAFRLANFYRFKQGELYIRNTLFIKL